jgi:hypothetical protein
MQPEEPPIEPEDREGLAEAVRKTKAGEKLTATERTALRRFRVTREEVDRWRYYATIPKKHWVKLSGRQHKVLDEQATRYGMPILGSVISLTAVARWIHDFLARNAQKLKPEEEQLLEGNSDWSEKYRQERTLLTRLERHEREGQLVSRDKSHQCWTRVAGVLRQAGETLQRQFGAAALRVLNQALENATREVDAYFSDGAQPDRSNDGDGDPPVLAVGEDA